MTEKIKTRKDEPLMVQNVVKRNRRIMGTCPNCSAIVYDEERRCYNCAQSLKWREEKC